MWRAGVVSAAYLIAGTGADAVVTATVTTAITVGLGLALVVCSRPAVTLLSAALAAADRACGRRTGVAILSPARILAAAAVTCAVLAWLTWHFWIRPRFSTVNLAPLRMVGLGIAAGGVVQLIWQLVLAREARRAAIAAAVTAASLAGALAMATYLWAAKPARVLAIWGETEVAGQAVDRVVNVWGLGRDLAPTIAARPGASAHPDIILVTIDTVRADRTPVYGGAATMPALARLAEDGAVLKWAFSPGNVTRRSLPAIVTGVAAARVRGRVHGWGYRLDPRHVTFPELLRSGGYDTAGFFCCSSIFGPDEQLGLVRGFDHVFIKEYACTNLAEAAAAYIARHKATGDRDPMFLWLHFFEPHQWHNIHVPGHGEVTMERRYAASLEAADKCLGTLLSPLAADIRAGKVAVAITSDHGEGLGSHGITHHSGSLYNSEIHVPLVIAGPGIKPQRLSTPVSVVDLAPTLLDLAGFVPPGMPAMDGESLLPLLRGQVPDDIDSGRAFAAMIPDHSTRKSARAVIAGRHKLISEDGAFELYDYIADPGETHDLARARPKLLKQMRQILTRRLATDYLSPLSHPN
ncbi:MAG TPA: sulfatase-like hydrolase/transferase, partial [Kofleriaceae bacterium]|nr:sulfatase-like hydrolase/transferase [Kofleriaceae bacterium]